MAFAASPVVEAPIDGITSTGPYCGVYSLYALAHIAGNNELKLSELTKPEFVSKAEGSTLLDLKKAAEFCGFRALPVKGLSLDVLRESSSPLILHVRESPGSGYNHYELFLGVENGKYKLYDPPREPRLMRGNELAAMWDRSGLVVSSSEIDSASVFAPARWSLLTSFGIVVFGVITIHALRRLLFPSTNVTTGLIERLGWSGVQTFGLCCVALAVAYSYHIFSEVGFLNGAAAVESIADVHFEDLLPMVDFAKLKTLRNDGVVVVDARWKSDFGLGHIPGAVNVEPAASQLEYRKALTGVPIGAQLVIYCQSAQCPYAVGLAKKLEAEGYANILYYKGGWVDWLDRGGEQSGRLSGS